MRGQPKPSTNAIPVRRKILTLAELEALAGLGTTRLLSFNHTRIAGQKPLSLESGTVRGVDFAQGTGDAQTKSLGLTPYTTAVQIGFHVKLIQRACYLKSLIGNILQHTRRKIGLVVLAVYHNVSATGGEIHTGNGGLSSTCFVCNFHIILLLEVFNINRFGILGLLLMFGTLIHIEVAEQLTTENTFGKHTFHRMFDDEARLARKHLGRCGETLAAGIARVANIHLLVHFLAGKSYFSCIDNNYIITAIYVRREVGFVLSPQQRSDFGSKTTQILVFGIYQNPFLVGGSLVG